MTKQEFHLFVEPKIGEQKIEAATNAMQGAETETESCTLPSNAARPRAIFYDGVKLIESELKSLRGTNWLEDPLIHFVYAHMSSSYNSI